MEPSVRRVDRAARVFRDVQRLLEHDCEAEAIDRLHARARRSRGWLRERALGVRDPRPTLEALLLEACWSADVGMIRLLLRLGASPCQRAGERGVVLDAVARTGPTQSLRELLVALVPERHLSSALVQASIAGRLDEVVVLLRARASPAAVVRLGVGAHLRLQGSILRVLKRHGARFSPGIERMLARRLAPGD